MATIIDQHDARTAPTRFVETGGRTLAYRMFGDGPPLVLCLRLRGVMDVWDPAFLDALAENFTVVTFDYTGLGQSTGTPSYRREALAKDARDLVDALGLGKVVIAGWSLGGIAAQIFGARYPESTSHVIAIGTTPAGPPMLPAEPIFLQTALKPDYTLEDEYILFFEPASAKSRAAADASHARIASRSADRSPVIPETTYLKLLQDSHDPEGAFPDHDGFCRAFYAGTVIPVLAICGDHDIVFPVESWYALNRKNTSLHILTFPQAGHGPQHEHPQICADAIASFVNNIA